MTSERRPIKSGQSSRRQAAQRSDRTTASSGRGQPAGDEAPDPMLKKVMFLGTGALILVFLGLLIWRAPALMKEPPPPPKKVVIDHTKMLTEVDDLAKKAATQFAAADRLKDDAERNKGIRAALETLAAAQEKLQALSERKEYQGEDYDQVFEEKQHKLSQEMKTYRDRLRVGAGR